MPSSITHAYFAREVYTSLPVKYKNKINSNTGELELFAQGSDPFMFYQFFIGWNAEIGKKLQHQMHTSKTRDFFLQVIKKIHDKNLKNNKSAMAFLYGYICHYYLDLMTHPFIDYQAGNFKRDDKRTYPYNTLHQKIEYRIDSYIILEKLKKNPKTFKGYQYLFKSCKLNNVVKKMMDEVLREVYSFDQASFYYQKAIYQMRLFWKYINYDFTGIKHLIYTGVDKVTPKYMVRLEELSFHTKSSGEEYLNLGHEKWCFPWDNSTYQETSFFDLFEIAKEKAINTIMEVTDMIDEEKIDVKRLKKLFSNLSYATGLNCEKEVKYQYFKEVN